MVGRCNHPTFSLLWHTSRHSQLNPQNFLTILNFHRSIDTLPSTSYSLFLTLQIRSRQEGACISRLLTLHFHLLRLNRYSMPVTRSRTGGFYDLNLDQNNTAAFLFGDEDGTNDLKQYQASMAAPGDDFPTLVTTSSNIVSSSSVCIFVITLYALATRWWTDQKNLHILKSQACSCGLRLRVRAEPHFLFGLRSFPNFTFPRSLPNHLDLFSRSFPLEQTTSSGPIVPASFSRVCGCLTAHLSFVVTTPRRPPHQSFFIKPF